jgi:hypothetical protein
MKNQLFLIAIGTLLCIACVPKTIVPIDNTAPTITQVTVVATPSRTYTPSYTFNSTEAGTITYGGDCSSTITIATPGNNTISFNTLDNGTYSNCTISVKDAANNRSPALAVPKFTVAWITKPLNDTGIRKCGDYADGGSNIHNNNLDCSIQTISPTKSTDGLEVAGTGGDLIPGGQDALYGRDVNGATNSDADGHKGFSFSKLNASGNEINIDCSSYDNNPADGTLSQVEAQACYISTPWSCVKDNVTNLIWEVKTTSGLQANSNSYTWFNSSGSNDGGLAGTANGGTCSGGTGCDTEKYVVDINTANICGETTENDWRLPTSDELSLIVANDRDNPAIDTAYFPNTKSNYYWSSSPYASNNLNAWVIFFAYGYDQAPTKNSKNFVRLVRDSQ